MAILNIRKEGDPILRMESRLVTELTPRIQTLIDDMIETMHAANGVGLAAVQVGVLRRIVVIEVEEGEIHVLINPEILSRKGHQEESEGCLSVPGRFGITERPRTVTVRATDREGKSFTLTGSDLLARAICHETDHLDGKLFTDCMLRELKDSED